MITLGSPIVYDVTDYGASTGAADNASAFASALSAAGAGGIVYVPSGTYKVKSEINITGRSIVGECSRAAGSGAIIQADATLGRVLYSTAGSVWIRDLQIDCADYADHGVSLTGCTGMGDLHNVRVIDSLDHAFEFYECQSALFSRLFAQGNVRGCGFYLEECNNLRLVSCAAQRSGATHLVRGSAGFRVVGDTQSGAARLVNCNAEGAWEKAFALDSTLRTTIVEACWSECSGADDLERVDHIWARDCVRPCLLDNTISGGGGGQVAASLSASYDDGTTSDTVDATTSKIAMKLETSTRAEWVSHVMVELASNASLAGTFRIETDSSGSPSGTLYHADLSASHTFAGTAPERVAFAGDVEVAASTQLWMVFERTAGSGAFEGSTVAGGSEVKTWNGSAWSSSTTVDKVRHVAGTLAQAVRVIDSPAARVEGNACSSTTVTGAQQVELEGDCLGVEASNNYLESTSASSALAVRASRLGSKHQARTRMLAEASAVPSVGTWSVGDIVLNSSPSMNGVLAWVCTASGTPGTWKTLKLGTVDADATATIAVNGSDHRRFDIVGGITRREYCPNTHSAVDTAGNYYLQAAGTTKVQVNSTGLGFYGSTPTAKPTVTGSRGGNAALASLLTALASLGLLTDSSS